MHYLVGRNKKGEKKDDKQKRDTWFGGRGDHFFSDRSGSAGGRLFDCNINSSWMLSTGAHTTYADEDYMETYFGVDPGNVGASGFSLYDPDRCFKDVPDQ